MTKRFVMSWMVFAALVILPQAALSDEAWKAYLENKKGETRDLGELRQVKDKDWLTVHYTEFTGYKPRLGVVASEEKTAYPPEYKDEFARMIVDLSGKG